MKEFADMEIEELEAALIVIKNEIASKKDNKDCVKPFNPEFEIWADGTINVQLPAIRGYNWQIVRKIGIGTYMTHVGEHGICMNRSGPPSHCRIQDSEDVFEVVEEWAAPDMRALWDEKTDEETIQACLNTLIPTGPMPRKESNKMKGKS